MGRNVQLNEWKPAGYAENSASGEVFRISESESLCNSKSGRDKCLFNIEHLSVLFIRPPAVCGTGSDVPKPS
jgi:hypothetical protein